MSNKTEQKENSVVLVIFVLLVIIGLSGMVMIQHFIGNVTIEAIGGSITEVNLEEFAPSLLYQGYYGFALSIGSINTTTYNDDAVGGQITRKDLVFDCLARDGSEVYASIVPDTSINIANVTAATAEDIDQFINRTFHALVVPVAVSRFDGKVIGLAHEGGVIDNGVVPLAYIS